MAASNRVRSSGEGRLWGKGRDCCRQRGRPAMGRALPLDLGPMNGRNRWLPADRSTSREGLDFDESTAVDPTRKPSARAIPPSRDTFWMSVFLIWAASPWEGRGPATTRHHFVLRLDLLGYGKRVVYLDAEIAHRAFQLRVPEKQLHRSQVARFLIYLCRLGPSHRMRAIGRAIKPSACDPRMDDPGILSGRQVRLLSDPAGKEVPGAPASNVGKPRLDRGSGLLGDLELPGRPIFF